MTSSLERLRTTFHGDFSSHASRWASLYRDGFHPWDRDGPSVALGDLLDQRTDLLPQAQDHDQRGNLIRDETGAVPRRTALVPGCGRGHDVLLLSSFGYDVVGLDCSEEALALAEENRAAAEAEGKYKPVEGLERGSIKWVAGDFFADTWSKGLGTDGSGNFDLIFDYTFLCALPPDVRPNWSKRMSELIHHKGRLVCLEFPSGKPLSTEGPPWGVNPEVYEALLNNPGGEVAYAADGSGNLAEETAASKPHEDALHRLCIVKPARTHKAGTAEDGSVTDFISVWSR